MKDFAEKFYKSKQWKKTRDLYAKSVGGLCEICLDKGLIVPGEIVHHKIFLGPQNINNPQVTLKFDNLQLVCRNCHADVHKGTEARRYRITETGEISLR